MTPTPEPEPIEYGRRYFGTATIVGPAEGRAIYWVDSATQIIVRPGQSFDIYRPGGFVVSRHKPSLWGRIKRALRGVRR